ncbi:Uncharacterized membrane protein, DUF485 family [Lentzea albidocapillata subsp. violacea]|uniref:Uncharacterized membrane protein, DUF485 family n=2 Tax=Lentzea albidocapillata TaxID=40571 RepID=A0A1G9J012_9PSEU|nr:Uncharacterized membrane protein, DUF485 family [Lentzea albidocapillata subsp. violacea]
MGAAHEGQGYMTKAMRSPGEAQHEYREIRGFASFDDPETLSYIHSDGTPKFELIRQTEEFRTLRRRLTTFVFPMTALFLASYLTFVLLSAYAKDFVSTKVIGVINLGILLGLGQFVTSIIITLGYARYAKRRLDPQRKLLAEKTGVEE